ncbi:hypothetical protein [Nocardia brasiliensis]|uniref:hypothetical protein n=1 Tax=Nocardia brasiliensis TaxID=37326 RepID=UPI003D8C337B
MASRAEGFAADPNLRAADTAPRPAAAQAELAAETLRELAAATSGLRERGDAAASLLNILYLEDGE